MSRRARAIAFACAALACAGTAAAVAGGYRADLESQFGPLRPAVVARARLPAREALRPQDLSRLLEVRRIPERFAPPGAFTSPEQAIGRSPRAAIPAGAYVLAGQLGIPRADDERNSPRLRGGRQPVEIAVSGAEALAVTGDDPRGRRVDVIVTTEPGPGRGTGRTYVAAERVVLLALAQSDRGAGDALPGPGTATWTATLALRRPQALRLIQAETFARQVRLIPR
ncbi:MAG TPA: SAF domain-containing protein [Solirubrobacterales bacterium]|nr:SAF domain-containing protein [Solirubrobacterales bacterium]